MKRFTAEQHRAWARMAQKRSCPPPSLLRKREADVRKHIENCAHCREELERLALYEALAVHLPVLETLPEDTPVVVGQIRAIRNNAAESLESQGEFFVPPTVLVLSVSESVQGLTRVAQIHDEPSLEDSGDVPLPSPCQGRFAESWNTYPVFSEYLGLLLAQTPDDVVARVCEQAESCLPEVPPNSPVEAFRSLEMDVGAYFSRASVNRSMKLLDQRYSDGMEPATTSKIISFPGKTLPDNIREQHTVATPVGGGMWEKKHPKTVWKGMAMAACLCIMIGAFWLNRPAPEYGHGVSVPVLTALQTFVAQGGGDTVRGALSATPLAWEATGVLQNLPAPWKAFAAGQWDARAKVGLSPEPFPEAWSAPSGKGAASWEAHPYYDLGVLAFATDMACRQGARPAPAMASALTQTAQILAGRILKQNGPEFVFVRALQESPLSCPTLQTHLDALDDALRRP